MKITVIGTGYVGLVSGACLADSGNDVTCVDINQDKVDRLNAGEVPIYEPGLTEIVTRNRKSSRLLFTSNIAEAMKETDLVLLAVGTPETPEGDADLKYLWSAVEGFAPHLPENAITVVKSTVPVGTNTQLYNRLRELTGRDCDVASNPEFLKEGAAIEDFTKPDRVVVGVRRPEVGERLHQLYAPFLRTEKPFLVMSPESAEMTKYVANCLLATKISFINEMANYCEKMNADINDVRRGIGHDQRIGFQFLFPGVGYGGSCFPKDIRALQATARRHGIEPKVLASVDEVNNLQKRVIFNKINAHFAGDLQGKTFAVWGLSFKPRTDDIREASALVLIDLLLEKGATVRCHDPEAMPNVKAIYGDKITFCDSMYDALTGASALAIMTEWNEFRQPNFSQIRRRLSQPNVFDGRNLYPLDLMKDKGFNYFSIGRPIVKAGG
jgi:UDPglucose 6-dehydrogenase